MEDMLHIFRTVLDSHTTNTSGNSLRPKKFHGHPHEDVEGWLDQFTRYADHAQLNDVRRLSCIKALLDHPASPWLATLDDNTANDLTLFTGAFRDRFALAPAHRFQLRQKFRDRKQTVGESVHYYAKDLAHMASRLAVEEDEHLHTFVQGLLPPIKTHVLCTSPETLEEAIHAASAKESAGPIVHDTGATTVAALNIQGNQQGEVLSALKKIEQSISSLAANLAQQPAPQPGKSQRAPTTSAGDFRCWYCDKVGHTQRMCNKRKQDMGNRGYVPQAPPAPRQDYYYPRGPPPPSQPQPPPMMHPAPSNQYQGNDRGPHAGGM
jgi:hypothetical protein